MLIFQIFILKDNIIIYLYDNCDQYTNNSMSVKIFTSKKDMYNYHIQDFFSMLNENVDQDSKRCWCCDYEKVSPLD
jgi:hypothetical protein